MGAPRHVQTCLLGDPPSPWHLSHLIATSHWSSLSVNISLMRRYATYNVHISPIITLTTNPFVSNVFFNLLLGAFEMFIRRCHVYRKFPIFRFMFVTFSGGYTAGGTAWCIIFVFTIVIVVIVGVIIIVIRTEVTTMTCISANEKQSTISKKIALMFFALTHCVGCHHQPPWPQWHLIWPCR